jgi:hypothetical protein
MKQAIKLIALSVLLLLSALAVKADQYGYFTYSTDGTNVTITGYTGSGGNVIIPDFIAGLPVTSIVYPTFSYYFSVKSVTIPAALQTLNMVHMVLFIIVLV